MGKTMWLHKELRKAGTLLVARQWQSEARGRPDCHAAVADAHRV